MNDEYLWDRTGDPDPDVAHLEQALSAFALRPDTRKRPRPVIWRWWAAAAAIAVVASGAAALLHHHEAVSMTSWQLSNPDGTHKPIRSGEWIETTGNKSEVLESESVGRVSLGPQSRMRLITANDTRQMFALQQGTIHALIWAPPAKFVVDTPGARTVDLGCAYTLHVAHDGTGLLTVEVGWVAFQWRDLESFIPAGAACRTRPGHGPDTPFFLDARPEFKQALAAFDREGKPYLLSTVLQSARKEDALSLWHLLARTSGNDRAAVFDRLGKLVSLPPTVTREAILRGDRNALDASWNALHLGDTSWWREWKRNW
jgi:hypothetical protein